jgi:AraC-like DNA-binding protein
VSEYRSEPAACSTCAIAASPHEHQHLTRLGRDILDYVLDVAIIHLEPDARPYHLTLADVAQCLRKTPRQLRATFDRLVEEGYLTIGPSPGRDSLDRRPIHPTAAALRTLEYFATCDAQSVEADIARLHAA